MLTLSDKWAPRLQEQPETGMGYQVATVILNDGKQYRDVVIDGGVITQVDGRPDVPFSEEDIQDIRVTKTRSG
jgi:hypothetical protein